MHQPLHPVRARFLSLVALGALMLSLAAPAAASAATPITLAKVGGGFNALTQVTNAGDGTDRLFVVEKRGTIRVIDGATILPGYFMDIRGIVADTGERGLLGVAFDPSFETNRRLYVFYTRNGGDIVISRYLTNEARTDVVESTARPIMLIEHSAASNHNGGAILFGPDGYLYLGVGDGGGSGDPGNDAQEKTTTFLGKVLRINVNGSGAGTYGRYSIPSDNPFRGARTGRDEIWAYGLRNPWRVSFDRGTGKMFIADVGQNRYEELNVENATITGGRNYGWSVMEGKHCFRTSSCSLSGDHLPILEYAHASGNCSITGGYVYRGTAYPALVAQYVFADFCSGRIWTAAVGSASKIQRADTSLNITSFGEAENGELYLVTINGLVYRVRG